jgi:hypothetical protein
MLDLSNVPQHYINDVQEFIDDNQSSSKICGKVVAELEPEEFVKFWLHWQGLIGWSGQILGLVEALGWRPTWKK